MSPGQIKILMLMSQLGTNKSWCAVDLLQRGMQGTPGTIGASMKFLVRSGHLEIDNSSRQRISRYKITKRGLELIKNSGVPT